jgi:hypothetical protein
MVLGATRSESLSMALAPSQKRKASQIGGNLPRHGPGLAENRFVVSDPETQATTAGQAKPKRLKRSYAFYDPLSASKRPNVTHGKQIYSCHAKAELPTKQGVPAQSQFNQAVTVTRAALAAVATTNSLRGTPMANTPLAPTPERRTEQVRKSTNHKVLS